MKKVLSTTLVLFLAFSFCLFFVKMCAPASWNVFFRMNNWYCENAVFVNYQEQDFVIVEGFNRGGYRSPDIGGLCVFNLSTKAVTGTFYKYRSVNVLGVTHSKVYVYDENDQVIGLKIGDLTEEVNVSERLNEHSEIKDIIEKIWVDGVEDIFRISGKDGYDYSYDLVNDQLVQLDSTNLIAPNFNKETHCYSQLLIPTKIKNKPILEGNWLCELGSNYNAIFENGDRLLSHKTLKGEGGKFLISRVGDDQIIWQTSEKEFQEQCDLEKPSCIHVKTNESTFYAFFQDGSGDGNLYILELDSKSGEILWSRELF